jgi:hypothetical protein
MRPPHHTVRVEAGVIVLVAVVPGVEAAELVLTVDVEAREDPLADVVVGVTVFDELIVTVDVETPDELPVVVLDALDALDELDKLVALVAFGVVVGVKSEDPLAGQLVCTGLQMTHVLHVVDWVTMALTVAHAVGQLLGWGALTVVKRVTGPGVTVAVTTTFTTGETKEVCVTVFVESDVM